MFQKQSTIAVVALTTMVLGGMPAAADIVVFSEDFDGTPDNNETTVGTVSYTTGVAGTGGVAVVGTNWTTGPFTGGAEGAAIALRNGTRSGNSGNGTLVQVFPAGNGFFDISSSNIPQGTEFTVSFDGAVDAGTVGAQLEVALGYKIDGGAEQTVVLFLLDTTSANTTLQTLSGSASVGVAGSGTITEIRPYLRLRRDGVLGVSDGSVPSIAGTNVVASYWDNVTITAIPEPASLALLGLGGVAALGRGRRGD